MTSSNKKGLQAWQSWAIILAVSAGIYFFPWRPGDLRPEALHMLAIFVGTILGIILKPLPMGAVAMIGLAASLVTDTVPSSEAFSGFSSKSVWLVVMAFFISKAIIKSGLGQRMAYRFIQVFGKTTLGLTYALLGVDLVLGSATPTSTARAGGVMAPIAQALARSYDSYPHEASRKRIGAYLMNCLYHGDSIVAIFFLTAGATKPLAQAIAADFGIEITWMNWFLGALVPGAISLLIVPLAFLLLSPPELRATPQAAQMAQEELEAQGPLSRDEKWTGAIFVLALVLWITGSWHFLDATSTAVLAVAFLLLTGVLSWQDILGETGAWNTLSWFAVLMMMAEQLNSQGFIPWFSERVAGALAGYSWQWVFVALCLLYFYSHYFFASLIAHVTAMYPAFLAVALAAGAPPLYAALMLAYVTNICASTTHYASGPASIIFATGYVTQGEWWRNGAVMGVIYLLIWLGIGSLCFSLMGWL
ncbi:DASS family sodium-coupled anion symporter [Aerococcus sanguinicola]|uniref:DASS family sodium-coupled anion symporter n=1 Tax=Aerococcus sanguinicola TaxID=119206 RepID=UPI0018A70F54|nr:DASS family sodium-coupled anion symporter [Aerococcus sanguinicola]